MLMLWKIYNTWGFFKSWIKLFFVIFYVLEPNWNILFLYCQNLCHNLIHILHQCFSSTVLSLSFYSYRLNRRWWEPWTLMRTTGVFFTKVLWQRGYYIWTECVIHMLLTNIVGLIFFCNIRKHHGYIWKHGKPSLLIGPRVPFQNIVMLVWLVLFQEIIQPLFFKWSQIVLQHYVQVNFSMSLKVF